MFCFVDLGCFLCVVYLFDSCIASLHFFFLLQKLRAQCMKFSIRLLRKDSFLSEHDVVFHSYPVKSQLRKISKSLFCKYHLYVMYAPIHPFTDAKLLL